MSEERSKSPDKEVLAAGPVLLDPHEARLTVDGVPARLSGKPLALLALLMRNTGQLVEKDRIFADVWDGRAVSDAVLTTAIRELRQALGDDARHPRFIETVHGRGYRFLLPLDPSPARATAEATASAAPVGGNRLLPALLVTALIIVGAAAAMLYWLTRTDPIDPAAAHPKSIAVLRFDDMTPNRADQWLADGMTEEILNALARTPDLRVASRTAATRLSRQGLDAVQAGRALGVANVLEGSVRRGDGRVRVTAQLIRTSDGIHLWSENFDAPEADIIAIQERIALRIASELKTVMDPAQLGAMASAGTRSVAAYRAYLRGLARQAEANTTGSVERTREASDAFEEARRLDPGFAEAHWRAAQKWFGNVTRIDSSAAPDESEARRLAEYRARVDAAIATSRDPTAVRKYRSARAALDLRLVDAFREMAAYLAARPRDVDGWAEMTDLAAYAGRRDWTARAATAIHRLSLEDGQPRSRAITASVMALRFREAAARAREQLQRRPGQAGMQYQAHRAFLMVGDQASAAQMLQAIRASDLPRDNKLMAEIRHACALGQVQAARVIAARLAALPDASISTRWQAMSAVGDVEAARRVLQPLDRPERLPTLVQFLIYPNFDAAAFPLLAARLRAQGIAPQRPVALPASCPAR